MRLSVDPSSPVPPFEQLRLAIVDQVRSGELIVGARLPTVRALAEELHLATNTVARAYRELEQDRVIETRGRAGSFIAASGEESARQSQAAARDFVDRMRRLGVSDDEVLSLVSAALRA